MMFNFWFLPDFPVYFLTYIYIEKKIVNVKNCMLIKQKESQPGQKIGFEKSAVRRDVPKACAKYI